MKSEMVPAPRSGSPGFVGRGAQLRALVSAVTSPPAVVLVEGEAGIGKSRLVAELAAAVLPERWVAVGRSVPEPFPYGPVLDALRGCGDRLTEPSPVTGALRPYLPELADRLPPEPAPLQTPDAERHRLFRAVRELIEALGAGVLIIEDLHWADPDTQALLRFLLTGLPRALSMVLTYRPEDTGETGPLGRACRPAPPASTLRLRLEPLDVAGVGQLAAAVLGARSVPGEFAATLHADTAGIPFVVEESLRDSGVGAALREATLDRLTGLSRDGRLVAQAAAVLGGPADTELLEGLTGIGAERSRAGIVEALGGNVLVELDDCRYGFRHAPGMRVVYETLPGPQRQDLHGRAAQVLRERDPSQVRALAEHSRKAGRVADWLFYGENAADSAAAAGDVTTATALLRQLLAEPAIRSSDVDRLAAKFGRLCSSGVDQLEVTAMLERLLFDRRTSDAVRGEIRLSLGLLLVRQTEGVQASRAELELAVGELRRRPILAARCGAVLALPYVGTTTLAECTRWMLEVEAAIETCEDPLWRTTLLASILGSRLHAGDPRTWKMIGQLPETVESADEQRELARAHCNLADACSWIGHYEKAYGFLHSGLQLAADCGAPYVASVGQSTRLHLDLLTGDWSGLADRASALVTSAHDLMPVNAEMSLVLGTLAAARGDWSVAEQRLLHTGMSTPDNAIAPVVIAAHSVLSSVRLSAGDTEAACEVARRGVELLRHKGVWSWAGEIVPQAVAVYALAGQLEEAAALVSELESALPEVDAPLSEAALLARRAELAYAQGELEPALEQFRAAKSAYDRLPRPYQALLLSERIASARLEQGAPRAADGLSDLADAFEALGATHDAARCRHRARANGAAIHPQRGRRGYGDQLSPREREVARLLASGRTNREIADVLFLSRRTVEHHVANVLRKHGTTSRNDLITPTGTAE